MPAKKNFGKPSNDKYQLKSTRDFHKQVTKLDDKSAQIIKKKLQLIKENPFRFKQLEHPKYQLFRVRLSIQRKETRLIYCIISTNIIILCLLERKKDYKDLEQYLEKLGKK